MSTAGSDDQQVCFTLHVRVKPGQEEEFLQRYERLAERVAAGVDGHVVHLLCQSNDEDDRWLIASVWQSLAASQAWDRSDEHRALTLPLRECWDEAQRTGFTVRTETRGRELWFARCCKSRSRPGARASSRTLGGRSPSRSG